MKGSTIGIIICTIIWWAFLGGRNVGAWSIQGIIVCIVGTILGSVGEIIARINSGEDIENIFPFSLANYLKTSEHQTAEKIINGLKENPSKTLDSISSSQDKNKQMDLFRRVIYNHYGGGESMSDTATKDVRIWFDKEKLSEENIDLLHEIFYRHALSSPRLSLIIQWIVFFLLIAVGIGVIFMPTSEEPVSHAALLFITPMLGIIPFFMGVYIAGATGDKKTAVYGEIMGTVKLTFLLNPLREHSERLADINFIIIVTSILGTIYKMW